MLPFENVQEGESIYFAVSAKYEGRLNHIAAAIQPSLAHLREFRLLFMVFSYRIELLHLCDALSLDDLCDAVAVRGEWQSGNQLDPVIGIVLSDHMAVRKRELPKLFVVSDGDVVTYWNLGTLCQMIDFIWLHEPGTECLSTPLGVRHEISVAVPKPTE